MKILLSKTRALMKVTAEILTENVIKKTFLRKSFVDIICSGLDIDYFARMKKKEITRYTCAYYGLPQHTSIDLFSKPWKPWKLFLFPEHLHGLSIVPIWRNVI